jgi:hypothetical protein
MKTINIDTIPGAPKIEVTLDGGFLIGLNERQASILSSKLWDANEELRQSQLPRLSEPVTPGRYKMRNGHQAFVLSLVDGYAVGYVKVAGLSGAHWKLDGGTPHNHPPYDLVERVGDLEGGVV